MVIVRRNRCDLGVPYRDLGIESGEFQMLLVFLWAIVATRKGED